MAQLWRRVCTQYTCKVRITSERQILPDGDGRFVFPPAQIRRYTSSEIVPHVPLLSDLLRACNSEQQHASAELVRLRIQIPFFLVSWYDLVLLVSFNGHPRTYHSKRERTKTCLPSPSSAMTTVELSRYAARCVLSKRRLRALSQCVLVCLISNEKNG